MLLTRVLVASLLVSVVAVGDGAAVQQKPMLLEQPGHGLLESTFLKDPKDYTEAGIEDRTRFRELATELYGFDRVHVLAEDLSGVLKDELTRRDVEEWARNRLENMGVHVVTLDEQRQEFFRDAGNQEMTEAEALRIYDRQKSYVYVNINALRSELTGVTTIDVSVDARRGVFMYPGLFTAATVWHDAEIKYFGTNYEAKEQIRKTLNGVFDRFEKDWKGVNH